ncbi:MAG TPA: RNA methyltransferase [Vicinamibacterales bacterium]|nr:RNA methyltransferase [Vicinamibacterales bacterium]
MPSITSRRHQLVQICREARAGGDDQPLLLDGWHLLREARSAGLAVDAVALGVEPPGALEAQVVAELEQGGTQVVTVSADVLQAMSPVRTSSGVVALARRPVGGLARVFDALPSLIVVAVDVQDPGNLGALVRAADAAGATGLIAAGVSADPLGWKALRAAMGSAFRLPLARVPDIDEVVSSARLLDVELVAFVPRAGTPLGRVDLRGPVCLLLGGEGPGLTQALLDVADVTVSIPMVPAVESLNVAVAGALAVYAAAEQRGVFR